MSYQDSTSIHKCSSFLECLVMGAPTLPNLGQPPWSGAECYVCLHDLP